MRATVADEKLEALEALDCSKSQFAVIERNVRDSKTTTGLSKHTINLGLYKYELVKDNYKSEVIVDKYGVDEGEQAIKVTTLSPTPLTDLSEARQAFKDISHGKHVYAIYHVDKFKACTTLVPIQRAGERVGVAMVHPAHYKDMAQLAEGGTYQLDNTQKVVAKQEIVWRTDGKIPIQGQDLVVVPMARNYAHLPCINKLEMLPDGHHSLWFHGINPKSHQPFMTFLKDCYKKGNQIKYSMPNQAGICAGTLSKDTDQTVVVGWHVSGNESAGNCTAEAVSPALLRTLNLDQIKDQAF
jgi:hypothetical protein